jgi:RNA polymerase sigma factor for flagellar operon FliA
MDAAALTATDTSWTHSHGRRRTRETLVLGHTDLVRRIAYRLVRRMPRHVEVDDLIQAGMIGLLEAAQRYECRAGASFETFAALRIRGAIVDSVRQTDPRSRGLRRRLRDIEDAKWRVERTTGRAATPADVASAVGVSLADYHRAVQDSAACRLTSLDDPSTTDTGSIHDTAADNEPGPADALEREDLRGILAAALGALPETERLVLSLYYAGKHRLREIGDQLKLSESRVCQIRLRAEKRLRSIVRSWTGADGTVAEPTPVAAAG